MLDRGGSTKNIVGFAGKADKKKKNRIRQLTPEEIAEFQARRPSHARARLDASRFRASSSPSVAKTGA